jgi:hypothetical protein
MKIDIGLILLGIWIRKTITLHQIESYGLNLR